MCATIFTFMVAAVSTIVIPFLAWNEMIESEILIPAKGGELGSQKGILNRFIKLSRARHSLRPISQNTILYFQNRLQGCSVTISS